MMLINEMTGHTIEVSLSDVIKAGKYEGFAELPAEEYFAAHAYYSNSFLKEVERSPAHALASRTEEREPTPAMELGTIVHCAVLERDRFEALHAKGPDVATKAAKEWKEAVLANPGKTLLKPAEWDVVRRMVDSIDRHPVASKLLTGGMAEHSAFWMDRETGIPMKARFDYLRTKDGVIVDLKTAADASFRGFQKATQNMAYHRQSAIYLDGFNVLTGLNSTMFPHVVIEKAPPYAVAVYLLDDATIEKGRSEYRHLLRIVSECIEKNEWPAYPTEIQSMNLAYF